MRAALGEMSQWRWVFLAEEILFPLFPLFLLPFLCFVLCSGPFCPSLGFLDWLSVCLSFFFFFCYAMRAPEPVDPPSGTAVTRIIDLCGVRLLFLVPPIKPVICPRLSSCGCWPLTTVAHGRTEMDGRYARLGGRSVVSRLAHTQRWNSPLIGKANPGRGCWSAVLGPRAYCLRRGWLQRW